MLEYSFQDLQFSATLAVYIAVSVVVAVVRWGHKCAPYSHHMDYYYPAWKAIVCCFFSSLVLLPSVFQPNGPDSVSHVKAFLMLSSPFYSAVIMFSYFGRLLIMEWWRKPILALTIPFVLVLFTSCFLTCLPGTQIKGAVYYWFFMVTGSLSVLFFICFVMAFAMTVRAIVRVSKDRYSNSRDFPLQFARRIIFLPVIHVAISWTIASIGTPGALSLGLLVLSFLNIILLLGALSPHRAKEVPHLNIQAASPVDNLSAAYKNSLAQTIRRFVEEEKGYLDSHLTLEKVSHHCGVNRTYVSQVINEKMGGFFSYFNHCRLEHAVLFKQEHPSASVEEIALASGFGSRQSYYNVRRQLGRQS